MKHQNFYFPIILIFEKSIFWPKSVSCRSSSWENASSFTCVKGTFYTPLSALQNYHIQLCFSTFANGLTSEANAYLFVAQTNFLGCSKILSLLEIGKVVPVWPGPGRNFFFYRDRDQNCFEQDRDQNLFLKGPGPIPKTFSAGTGTKNDWPRSCLLTTLVQRQIQNVWTHIRKEHNIPSVEKWTNILSGNFRITR